MRVLFFLILLPTFLAFGQEEREYYMLKSALHQEISVPKKAIVGAWALDLGWTSLAIGATYVKSLGNVPLTAAIAAYEIGASVGLASEGSKYLLNGKAWWDRQSFMKEITAKTDAEKIHVFTTGDVTGGGLNPQLHANSVILIEQEKGKKLPPPIQGMEWVKVKDLESTKIRLNLSMGDAATDLPAIEISLRDFLDKKQFDPKLAKQWQAKVQELQGGPTLKDKILKSGLKTAKIESSLIMGDKEIPLGGIAEGKSVKKFLRMKFLQIAFDKARPYLGLQGRAPGLDLKTARVLNAGVGIMDCKTMFVRFTGGAYIR